MLKAFVHCPNSFCNPPSPSALKRALWGTSSPKKCPKPFRQGSRPPQNQANSSQKSWPKPSGQDYFTLDFNMFHQLIFLTSSVTAKVAFCVFSAPLARSRQLMPGAKPHNGDLEHLQFQILIFKSLTFLRENKLETSKDAL